ncbi:MAG TPA: LytTR family DNA-binding domain-containing protein [Chthoniobacteraceae bacterium]|jgi:two-component system LytT family response regulator
MKLRVLIIDDESLARDRLRRLLGSDPEVEIVGECADGPSALEQIRERRPDLLLLDVQMPGMDGFEMLRKLGPGELPGVVFVTAYDEHAVRAFESRALDYLLKPPTKARLAEAISRARQQLHTSPAPAVPQALLDLLAEREAAATRIRRIAVKSGERLIFVPTEQIDWVEAAGNYAVLHVGKETHILRETMGALEAQLPPEAFLRVSRSAILNLRRVKELLSQRAGEHDAILLDGQRIGITRSLREVEERLRFA